MDDYSKSSSPQNFWQQLNLRSKTALLAFIIGVVPMTVVGTIAYGLLQNSSQKQISQAQLQITELMSAKFASFLDNHFNEVRNLAQEQIFTNPDFRKTTTVAQKQAVLTRYSRNFKVYDNIIFFDIEGNPLFQSKSNQLLTDKYSDRSSFKQALQTKQIVLNQPGLSTDSQEIFIEYLAPIQDENKGEVIGILSLRIEKKQIYKLFANRNNNFTQWHLVNSDGTIVAGVGEDRQENKIYLFKPINQYFPQVAQLHSAKQSGLKTRYNQQEKELISYVPLSIQAQNPELEPYISSMGIFVQSNGDEVLQSLHQLRLILLLGVSLTTLFVILLSAYLSEYITRPIVDTVVAVSELEQGELDTRINIKGQKEFVQLSNNINQLAERMQQLIIEQEQVSQEQMQAQTLIVEQERQNSEVIQTELLEFLSSIEGVSEGDLTVRADITDSQIGIVADFFNSIIENLRDIITQVKATTNKVNFSIGQNENVIGQVAQEALQQAEQINQTLNALETMTSSIQEVASNAQKAAHVSQSASESAEMGGKAIEQTVSSILQLRETVAATAKKVKRLGESSQEISKVISLINQIAMQTNMLAINASIEASRAGEEGRGFAVVAEEVGELAVKSAEATKEIEEIVETIQEETADVVAAMELGTYQVVEGTRLVEDTKRSLDHIVQVSQQIDRLLQSISGATSSQAQTSQVVSQLMKEVAQVSQRTSDASRNVFDSLDETVKIAQKLESSVNTFKV
ncbi:MAG: methyl-accepting chemotaxis protein [Xenococcaceae cyanobacterium MO_188.B29]|nr:methyl-accepting chemotaxis protein [Xenococcaceae cyanobacterium MO_188.B29]